MATRVPALIQLSDPRVAAQLVPHYNTVVGKHLKLGPPYKRGISLADLFDIVIPTRWIPVAHENAYASKWFDGLTEKYPQPFNEYAFTINKNIAFRDLINTSGTWFLSAIVCNPNLVVELVIL